MRRALTLIEVCIVLVALTAIAILCIAGERRLCGPPAPPPLLAAPAFHANAYVTIPYVGGHGMAREPADVLSLGDGCFTFRRDDGVEVTSFGGTIEWDRP